MSPASVPRRLLIPLLAVTAAAAGLWVLTGADTRLSEHATDVLSAAAAALTVVSTTGWLAFAVRDRDKDLLIKGIVEARKRAAKDAKDPRDPSGPLRRVQ